MSAFVGCSSLSNNSAQYGRVGDDKKNLRLTPAGRRLDANVRQRTYGLCSVCGSVLTHSPSTTQTGQRKGRPALNRHLHPCHHESWEIPHICLQSLHQHTLVRGVVGDRLQRCDTRAPHVFRLTKQLKRQPMAELSISNAQHSIGYGTRRPPSKGHAAWISSHTMKQARHKHMQMRTKESTSKAVKQLHCK